VRKTRTSTPSVDGLKTEGKDTVGAPSTLDSANPLRTERPTLRRPKVCYLIGGYLLLAVLLSAIGAVAIHLIGTSWISESWVLRTHAMCGCFGALGASMAAMRKYYRALITESTDHSSGSRIRSAVWDWGWIYYYLTRPVLGGLLGSVSFTLSFVGFQVLAENKTIQLSNQGRYLLYGVAFLCGFSVSHVLDRLNSIAKQAFRPTNAEPD